MEQMILVSKGALSTQSAQKLCIVESKPINDRMVSQSGREYSLPLLIRILFPDALRSGVGGRRIIYVRFLVHVNDGTE